MLETRSKDTAGAVAALDAKRRSAARALAEASGRAGFASAEQAYVFAEAPRPGDEMNGASFEAVVSGDAFVLATPEPPRCDGSVVHAVLIVYCDESRAITMREYATSPPDFQPDDDRDAGHLFLDTAERGLTRTGFSDKVKGAARRCAPLPTWRAQVLIILAWRALSQVLITLARACSAKMMVRRATAGTAATALP